jgi:hypothetical protein
MFHHWTLVKTIMQDPKKCCLQCRPTVYGSITDWFLEAGLLFHFIGLDSQKFRHLGEVMTPDYGLIEKILKSQPCPQTSTWLEVTSHELFLYF